MQPIIELRRESKNSLSAVEEDPTTTNRQRVQQKLAEELAPGFPSIEQQTKRNSPKQFRSLSLRKQGVDKSIVRKVSTKFETSMTCSTKANIPSTQKQSKKKGKIVILDQNKPKQNLRNVKDPPQRVSRVSGRDTKTSQGRRRHTTQISMGEGINSKQTGIPFDSLQQQLDIHAMLKRSPYNHSVNFFNVEVKHPQRILTTARTTR